MKNTDVTVIGKGPSGLSASVFTARADLDTVVMNEGEPILRRNAHLENFLGFPAGVNSRLFVDMGEDQARRNGVDFEQGKAKAIEENGDGFMVKTDKGDHETSYVVVASWSDASYLNGFDIDMKQQGSKTYVETEDGRTSVDGLYVTGRLAGQPHQTIVNAGHGAKVGLSVIHDSEVPFYHDWVTPEGYFTGRGREVPPGCEEIDEEERMERERETTKLMREYFAEPHPDEPTMHPSVTEDG